MTNNEKIRQIEHQLAELEDAPETRIREKIDLLNKLAWLLRDNDAKRSFALCNAAYSLSDGSDGSDQMYQAGIAYSLRTQGFLNMRAADYAEGLTQLHEAQEIFESLSLYDGLADVFFAINGIYFYLGDYPQALEMVYKQMEAAQHIGDRHRIADANNNLAYIYLAVGEQEQGMDLLKRNLPLAQEIKDERIECAIYIKLLQGYLEVGDYQSALEYGFRGLHKSRELGNKQFEMRAHGWLGQYYLGINDKAKTISHLEKALELSRKREAKVFEVLSLINMGQAYREFHQFDQAIEVLNLAEMIGQAISLKLNLFKCHLLQSEIYEELGDSTQALHYYKQYHAVKELVFNGNADQRLKMLQVVHETETAKKEAEIAHLKTIDLQQEIAERKQVELQLQHQLELAHALSTFKETLLAPVSTQHDKHRLLVDALQPLLKHIGASKAYLYENVDHPELGFSSRLIVDAPAPGISSSFDNPDSQSVIIPWSAVPDENRRRLAEGQPVGGLVRNLFAAAPSFRDYLLNEQHVLSVQFFPIHINDTWWGYIGFDDHIHEREWNENDILLLNTAVGIVKSTMQRWWAEDKLRELNQQLEEEVQKQTSELRKTVKLLQKEVNERKRAEAEIQHMVDMLEQRVADRSRELAALYDMTILFTEAQNLTDMLEPALQNICQNVKASGITVHILSADKSHLQLAAQLDINDWQRLKQIPIPPNFTAWIDHVDMPLMVRDKSNTPPFLPEEILLPSFPTYFGAPLRVRNEVIGLLGVYREENRPFSVQKISLLVTMAEQLGIIIQNHRLQEETQHIARTIERQQLSRELHDSVAQRIYSLHLFASAGLEALHDDDPEDAIMRLEQVNTNALEALREMRLLLYQLRPLALENQTLPAAFEKRFDLVERRMGITAIVEDNIRPNLSEEVEEELFYIITEALNNSLKHAEATEVKLLFSAAEGQTLVIIEDNGRGFDPDKIKAGLGLENIYQRTDKIGGLVTLDTAVGQGTTVRINI